MIDVSRKSALIAGVAVILVTNAVALGGVAYNRSDAPESSLRLSERELQPAADWGGRRENSGVTLTLRWRTLGEDAGNADGIDMSYGRYYGPPKWLDRNKLATLGFDTSGRQASMDRASETAPARQVLLVLELDGASYRAALERARKLSARADALSAANAAATELRQKAKTARENLSREVSENSRLFVVDAGSSVETLRSRYPDRARYAIVRGQVRPQWNRSPAGTAELVGYVSGVSADQINVPLALHSSLAPEESARSGPHVRLPPTEITVAFGRRLEPWIAAAVTRRVEPPE